MRALHRVRVMFLMLVVSLTALSAACGDNFGRLDIHIPLDAALHLEVDPALDLDAARSPTRRRTRSRTRRRARSTSTGTRTDCRSDRGPYGSRSTSAPCLASIGRRTRSSPTSTWSTARQHRCRGRCRVGCQQRRWVGLADRPGHQRRRRHGRVGEGPRAVIAASGSIWVSVGPENAVKRIDPATNQVTVTISDVPDPAQLAAATDAIWVTSRGGDVVSRISPTTDRRGIRRRRLSDARPRGDRRSCVGCSDRRSEDLAIDPATNRVTAQLDAGYNSWALAPDATGVWLTLNGANTVSKISAATNEVIETMDVGPRPIGLAVEDDAVWVANSGDNTVWRISTD